VTAAELAELVATDRTQWPDAADQEQQAAGLLRTVYTGLIAEELDPAPAGGA
jgi:hypothetical protein